MSIDFEQRLRSEMSRVAVRPRPGLVGDAYRACHARRRTARAVAAGAAAVAAVAGTAIGAGVTASPGAVPAPIQVPARTTAYVVSHVSSALAATSAVDYTSTHYTVSGGPSPLPGLTTTVGHVWRSGNRERVLTQALGGRPRYDVWVQRVRGKTTVTNVDYSSRTWTSWVAKAMPPLSGTRGCDMADPMGDTPKVATATDWKSFIEARLRCGDYRVAGRQRVDGIDTIKLAGRLTESNSTLWVDPRTYLPVRVAGLWHLTGGRQAPGGKPAAAVTITVWSDFRWLPLTRANLAQLTGTIPPGFRHVDRENPARIPAA
jgi:hypothetical protein